MKRSRREPPESSTPSAAYRACVRSAAISTSRCSSASSDSSELSAMPASMSRRIRTSGFGIRLQLRAQLGRTQKLRSELGVRRHELLHDTQHERRVVAERADDLVPLQERL